MHRVMYVQLVEWAEHREAKGRVPRRTTDEQNKVLRTDMYVQRVQGQQTKGVRGFLEGQRGLDTVCYTPQQAKIGLAGDPVWRVAWFPPFAKTGDQWEGTGSFGERSEVRGREAKFRGQSQSGRRPQLSG